MQSRESALAFLTGMPHERPDTSRAPVVDAAQEIAEVLGHRLGVSIDAATTLTGRAALLGLRRRGRTSAGGTSRLVAGTDGWCAINLSRPDDIAAVPALIETDSVNHADPWPAVEHWAAAHSVLSVVERARLLDIPAAVLGQAAAAPPGRRRCGPPRQPAAVTDLLVVDLSSMWAGPLCGSLLRVAGATVVKVESPRRTDGARSGPPAFFDWVNGGKLSVTVDFDEDAEFLRELLSVADVVIEGSRPAALARRGLGPDDTGARPGRVWLRITGYGAASENAHTVAFGDDAAVAGGLVGGSSGGPVFCGDAIADPLTGLHGALAIVESLDSGGGEVIDVSMAATAATYAAVPVAEPGAFVAVPPPMPGPSPRAPRLGADDATVRQLVVQRSTATC
ncbi:CoA transferase [Mycolicibacterium sp. 3033]|nr:CoA transferase [Mycolicibacterium aurantiacum]